MRFVLGHYAKTPEAREALRLAKLGEKHPLWKGDAAGIAALHAWLARNCPKTGRCEECGAHKATAYALIFGKTYSRNRDDYRELCAGCHNRYDSANRKAAA